jgi:hypothetical protein
MLSCLVELVLLPLPSLLADPDSLQDFCVADLSASTLVNGFLCKPASNVSSDDFFFDGLRKEENTTNIFGSNVTIANVLTFPGLLIFRKENVRGKFGEKQELKALKFLLNSVKVHNELQPRERYFILKLI